LYLTAQEAADELGVSVATLYAYVSRKQIRSQRVPHTRSRQYWREDIEALKRQSVVTVGDALVPQSAITLITDEGPFYRGRSAIELAESESLETVCGILWGPESVSAFDPCAFQRPPLYDNVAKGLSNATLIEKATALLPILERANPRSYDLSPAGYCRTGAEVMRWFAAMLCGEDDPSDEPIHLRIAKGLAAPKPYRDIIRRVLVIAADNELDPTTYAVRAVANTGVSAYQIVVAGLASSVGRRLSFGRSESLAAMINEIMTDPDPKAPVLRRLREGEPVYGFGSRVYPQGDPRAVALMRWIDEVAHDDPELHRLKQAIAVAEEVTGLRADFVIPLSFVSRKLGQPQVNLLRLARIAGWIAHAMEQYHSQELVRPRTIYKGVLPRA
jgi:citrate synthase